MIYRQEIEKIKEILPESTQIELGKWDYKGNLICIPCGFIKTPTNKILFSRRSLLDFERVLNLIK